MADYLQAKKHVNDVRNSNNHSIICEINTGRYIVSYRILL